MTEKMLRFHKIANAFPLLSGKELAELADDIATHGLHTPIVMFDGQILDGRNRYRAARKAHVALTDAHFVTFDGDWTQAMTFVVGTNLKRRHLTESQRAWVASRLAAIPRPGTEAEVDEPAGKEVGEDIDGSLHQLVQPPPEPTEPMISQAEAARQMKVGRMSVQRARAVQTRGIPELGQAVEAGEIPVSAAAAISNLPPEEQREALAGGVTRVRRTAAQVRRRDRPEPQPEPTPEPAPALPNIEDKLHSVAEELTLWTDMLVRADTRIDRAKVTAVARTVRAALDRLDAIANGVTDEGLRTFLAEESGEQ